MTYIMKRIIAAAASCALCLSLFAGCGDNGSSSASSQAETKAAGNASAFNLSESHIKGVLACAWVNQNDLNEKIKFNDDLDFTHYIKSDRYSGKATLDEKGGLLTLTYDDDAFAEKSVCVGRLTGQRKLQHLVRRRRDLCVRRQDVHQRC